MVMTLNDIKKLADLARVEMTDSEMEGLARDFDSILAYIKQVQEVSKLSKTELLHENSENYLLRNVMREDVVTNKAGEYKESILADAPDTKDGYLRVKQIL